MSTGSIYVQNWLDLVYNEMFKLRFYFPFEYFLCYFSPLIPLPILLIKNKNSSFFLI